MKFFEGVRPSVYLQAARLRQDKKTSVLHWNLTLAITMNSALAHACAEMIVSNFAQIATAENKCGGLDISEDPPLQRIRVFKLVGDKEPVLSLGHWGVSGLRMVKVDGLIELWASIEHVCADTLHGFVKGYAFKRVWLEFQPNAEAPDPSPSEPTSDAPVESVASLAGRIEAAGLTEAVVAVLDENAGPATRAAKAAIKRASRK